MYAILGATGKVGRSTIHALLARGQRVRAIVRNEARASDLRIAGCEVVEAPLEGAARLGEALAGADGVQVICPTSVASPDAMSEMRRTVAVVAEALQAAKSRAVVALSDYGAERASGTGITVLFYELEARLRRLDAAVTFVRSAEHMQNWARVLPFAAETGFLPTMHHPLTKAFPTVSALDVGQISAEMLTSPPSDAKPRVVHVEGPRRVTAADVAAAVSHWAGREVAPRENPPGMWLATLTRGGLSESYAKLVVELFDAHNAGLIDAESGVGTLRRGATELGDALAAFAKPGPPQWG